MPILLKILENIQIWNIIFQIYYPMVHFNDDYEKRYVNHVIFFWININFKMASQITWFFCRKDTI